MILKFDQFLNEAIDGYSPDKIDIDGKELRYTDKDAIPFVWYSEKHKIMFGNYANTHVTVPLTAYESSYPGRLWFDSKIMAFWVYPSEELFKEMCKSFKNDYKIKILDNGWRILVLKEDGEIKRKDEVESEYLGFNNWTKDGYIPSIIPVEEYIESENAPEELYKQHLLSPLHKKGNVITKFPGYKHKKLAYQLPGETEAKARARMYQERFLNESNITDEVFHRTGLDSLEKILKSGKILLSSIMGGDSDIYSKKPYYLSMSRTRNFKLGYGKNKPVTIEFDGRALKTKYKGKSIDYWYTPSRGTISPSARAEGDEFEDRIFSDNPFLGNLEKYIKNIDIVIYRNNDWQDYIKRMLDKIKGIDSPLLKKIRIFQTMNDFNKEKDWISIENFESDVPPKEETTDYLSDRSQFDFDLFAKIMKILMVGNKKISDKEYVKDFIKKHIDKFIEMGVVKLKNIKDEDISPIVYDIQYKGDWLASDRDFFLGVKSRIHNITKSSSKSEFNYHLLKLLSDEMIKYKVDTLEKLVDRKMGQKEDKKIDYAKYYTFVYKNYNGYQVIDNNKSILWWHKLRKWDIDRIHKTLPSNRYEINTKDILNYFFNNYDEDMAKRHIASILDDKDYILVDTRERLIYPEIYDKDDSREEDIGKKGWWSGYINKDKWYVFLQENLDKSEFEKLQPRINKLYEDDNTKIRLIYTITEKLLGEDKADEFFKDNGLKINKEERYMVTIGKPVLQFDPELVIRP